MLSFHNKSWKLNIITFLKFRIGFDFKSKSKKSLQSQSKQIGWKSIRFNWGHAESSILNNFDLDWIRLKSCFGFIPKKGLRLSWIDFWFFFLKWNFYSNGKCHLIRIKTISRLAWNVSDWPRNKFRIWTEWTPIKNLQDFWLSWTKFGCINWNIRTI